MEYDVFPVDTEDCASILLRFENGAIGSLTISQMFPGKKNQMRFALAGTRRSAEWDSEDLQNLSIGRRDGPNLSYTKDTALVTPGAGALVSYPAGHAEGFPDAFKQGFRQFYASIGNPDGEYQYATFEDGLREMVLCDRIFESAKQNVWMGTGRSAK